MAPSTAVAGQVRDEPPAARKVEAIEASSRWDRETLLFHIRDKKTMIVRLLLLAAPAMAANIVWFSQQAIVNGFVGHRMGEEALAQYAVGLSIFNVVGLSLGIGLASALDTLASQAFGRSHTNPEIGELLQRSVLVDVVLSVPLVVLFRNVEPIIAAVYDAELARGAAQFLCASWLLLPLNIVNNSIIKILQAQNLPQLQLYCCGIGTLVAVGASHFVIEDSLAQGAMVLTMTHIVMFAALSAFAWYHPQSALRYTQWPIAPALWNWAEMKAYLALGIPSLLSLCAEWWAFEILIVLAAQVSDFEVTMLSVILSITGMAFSVALGVSVAGSVCIGNSLGENQPEVAKAYAYLTFGLDQCVTLFPAGTILIARWWIPTLFSTEDSVISRFAHIALIVAVFHWGDSTQFTFQGIFRGAGKQASAARAVLASLWLVGVPCAWYFGVFHRFGAGGILLGLICGFLVEVPLMLKDARTWDWAAMAETASKSLHEVCHRDADDEGSNHADDEEMAGSSGGAHHDGNGDAVVVVSSETSRLVS